MRKLPTVCALLALSTIAGAQAPAPHQKHRELGKEIARLEQRLKSAEGKIGELEAALDATPPAPDLAPYLAADLALANRVKALEARKVRECQCEAPAPVQTPAKPSVPQPQPKWEWRDVAGYPGLQYWGYLDADGIFRVAQQRYALR